jgi:hypothetical protein
MLYARMNKEYVNEDELAKGIVRELYRKQIKALYGEEKETKANPSALSSQLKYGIDSLFENFRNSVEQVLSADYNGDLTQQKSYEVIKKYNQLSSYLKNVINIKALTKDDQDAIEKQFDDMKDKLLLLKKIATDNNFIDKDDISDMVNTILKIKDTKDLQKVSSQSTGMVKNIKNKNESLQLIQDSINNLITIENDLKNPYIQKYTKLQDMKDEYKLLSDSFNDPDLNPLEFSLIKKDSEETSTLLNEIKTQIQWFEDILKKLQSEGKVIEDVITTNGLAYNGFASLEDVNIQNKVDKVIDELKDQILTVEQAQIAKIDPTDIDIVNKTRIINAKWKKELDKLERVNVDNLIQSEIAERNNEYKKELPRFETEYKKTTTYLNTNDRLDENQLLLEEKELNRITSELDQFEESVIKVLENMTEKFKKTVTFKPTKVQAPPKVAKKAPPQTQATAKKAPTAKLPPIFTTESSFIAEWQKTMTAKNNGAQLKGFLLNKTTSDPKTIKKYWSTYKVSTPAEKAVFFT